MQLLPRRAPATILDPVVSALARTGVTPNAVSTAGLAGNVAAGALAAGGFFLAAGVVALIASSLDLLDGGLARATGRVTRFGALYDSVLDRLSEAALLGGLLFHYSDTGLSRELGVVIFAAMVGSILVSYVRARAEGLGLELREGLFTRAERVILMGGALIIGGAWPGAVRIALWALAVMANLTVAQRVLAVRQALRDGGELASEPGQG